jgi:cytochrome c biogenesis protein CcmG/thiol:disulfide interchange protein DsbE
MKSLSARLIALAAVAVIAAILIGVWQLGGSDRATGAAPKPLSLAEVSKPIAGAPPVLAALRRRVNELNGGGTKAFDAQLRALRGHPVVVNLWASWCDPCRYELPFLQRVAVDPGAQVAFLGVNATDAPDAARAFAARYPMPYPSFEDPRGKLAGRYGARGLPATAFYDAAGKLVILHQGVFPTQQKLVAALERYALQ